MKIRFYRNLNGMRWLGLCYLAVLFYPNVDPETQWVGCPISILFNVDIFYSMIRYPGALMEYVFTLERSHNWIVG